MRRQRRYQGQQTGPEHGMAKNATTANQFSQTTAGQLGEDIAPEEAAKHKVGLVCVPGKALLDDSNAIAGGGVAEDAPTAAAAADTPRQSSVIC